MYLIPWDDRVATSIHYKEMDNHSYLNFKSSHPFKCKASIPTSQFLRLRKICSEDDGFDEAATTMESFFVTRGYPAQLVQEGRRNAALTPRAQLLAGGNPNQTGTNRVPMVTTYHPKNTPVCKILSRNYNILTNDDSTRVIFSQPPLQAYRRAKNLRDLLVHSDFPPDQPPSPASELSVIPVLTLTDQPQFHHQEDKSRSQGISRALRITSFTAFLAVNALGQSTSGRQGADWLTVSGNIASTCCTRKVTCLLHNILMVQAIH